MRDFRPTAIPAIQTITTARPIPTMLLRDSPILVLNATRHRGGAEQASVTTRPASRSRVPIHPWDARLATAAGSTPDFRPTAIPVIRTITTARPIPTMPLRDSPIIVPSATLHPGGAGRPLRTVASLYTAGVTQVHGVPAVIAIRIRATLQCSPVPPAMEGQVLIVIMEVFQGMSITARTAMRAIQTDERIKP